MQTDRYPYPAGCSCAGGGQRRVDVRVGEPPRRSDRLCQAQRVAAAEVLGKVQLLVENGLVRLEDRGLERTTIRVEVAAGARAEVLRSHQPASPSRS